jgi:putative phosphoesterase
VKLGILSDIHVDINLIREQDFIIPSMADFARTHHLDAWLIAGDISSDYRLTLEALRKLESLSSRPCFFVPGNHDIWTEKHKDMNSWEIYHELQSHERNVSREPVKLKEGWYLTGDLGWYDYSFGDPAYTAEDFDRMIYRDGCKEERVWQDSVMAVWNRPTRDTHEYFLSSLEKKLSSRSSGNLIVMTHVLPIEDFTVGMDHPQHEMWKYLNAFLGGKSYGELLFRHPSVRYSICGHIHYRKEALHRGIRFYCACLGYSSEWASPDDPASEIENAAVILDI